MLTVNSVLAKYVLYMTQSWFLNYNSKDTFPITSSLDGAQVSQPSKPGRRVFSGGSLGEIAGQEEEVFVDNDNF